MSTNPTGRRVLRQRAEDAETDAQEAKSLYTEMESWWHEAEAKFEAERLLACETAEKSEEAGRRGVGNKREKNC